MSKALYVSRVAPGLSEEERSKLIFEETSNLEQELLSKSTKTSRWSKFFGLLNTILNLIVIVCSAIIVIISAIVECQNIPVIVLGGVIFAISSSNELLKLGPRGFNYQQGTIRLRRIRRQLKDILFMFHTYTTEQVLAFLSSFHAEIDEIDLDLYKSSMTGEVKYENGNLILTDSQPNTPNTPLPDNSHIHIHIDTPPASQNNSPINSPNNSQNNSPSSSPKNTLDVLKKDSLPKIHIRRDSLSLEDL